MWYVKPILSLTGFKTEFPRLVPMSTDYYSYYSFLPLGLWGHSFQMKKRQLPWLQQKLKRRFSLPRLLKI